MGTELFSLRNVTLRVRDRHILEKTNWTIEDQQHWAVIGPNGSGKTTLVRSLVDEYIIVKGSTFKHPLLNSNSAIGFVSFEQQQALHDHNELMDQFFSFSGRTHQNLTAEHVIRAGLYESTDNQSIIKTANTLGIDHLLDRTMISLSNGEIRRVLIARALSKNPLLLILDEPFEGLDADGRDILEHAINQLIASEKSQVILATHRFEHLSSEFTHILCLKDCRLVAAGSKDDISSSGIIDDLYAGNGKTDRLSAAPFFNGRIEADNLPATLVSMKNVSVSYDGEPIIENFSWVVEKGSHWIITGPNGSGKSTILRLIFGDLPQVYANDITIAGYKRGTGESLWDIRRNIGFLSPEFHMGYRKTTSLLEVVLSGFYDSIGLFRSPGAEQIEIARLWLDKLGFRFRESEPLAQFSFGEQRLILLARGLVKNPSLLILDEPLLGLDPGNRKMLRTVIDDYGFSGQGSIIHVTHHQEEVGSCFTHILRLRRVNDAFWADASPFSPLQEGGVD